MPSAPEISFFLLRTDGGHGELDAFGGDFILDRARRDDAVAVLERVGNERLELVDLFDGDFRIRFRADALQRELGGLLRAEPVSVFSIQRGEAERRCGGDEVGEVGDGGDDPFEEAADVFYVDAAGGVLRDQCEEVCRAEQVFGGDAGERPVRRIELVGVAEVVRGFDDELGGAADAAELHAGLADVFRIVHGGLSPGCRFVWVSFEIAAMSGSEGSPRPAPAARSTCGRRPRAGGSRPARPRRTAGG